MTDYNSTAANAAVVKMRCSNKLSGKSFKKCGNADKCGKKISPPSRKRRFDLKSYMPKAPIVRI
jgi:hypothetical protein